MSALFLKVLNISISASYLVAAVVAARFLLKKAPRWLYPVLWGLVALRLIFPVSVESVLSLLPSAEPIPPDIVYAARPAIDSGIPIVNQAVNPVIAQTFAPDPAASANPLQILLEIGGWAWLAGMAVMILYTLITYLRLRRRVRTAVPLGKNQYQCETVASPFVLGLFRPRIYLPFGLGEEALFYIVAHEQAHIRRRDHFWKPLGFLLLAVHWFNPLMWLAYILLCRDIELACDEKVIKQLGREGRADYSQALLSCSVSRRSIAACPLAFGEVGVKARVKSVLHYKRPGFWIVALALVSSLVLAVGFLTDPKEEPRVQPGDYQSKEILYSTVATLPNREVMQDQLECKIRPDNKLSLQRLTEEGQGYGWSTIGELKPCEFSNKNLEELIRFPDSWLEGSLNDIGKITDAYAAVKGEKTNSSSDEGPYILFCTEDDALYFAQCSVMGDREKQEYTDHICYLARLAPAAPADLPLEDAGDWGILLSVEKASPTAASVVFAGSAEYKGTALLCGNDYLLEREEDGVWTKVKTTTTPTFIRESTPISEDRRHLLSWEWLYGELPDGHYRIGKQVARPDRKGGTERRMAYGEFYLRSPESGKARLSVGEADSTGARIYLWPLVEGMTAGEDFVLQSWDNGQWTDLPTLADPGFGPGTAALSKSDSAIDINWEPLYGALPDGRYRLGKQVWEHGRENEKTMLYGEFTLSLTGKKPRITLEEIIALAEEGRVLTPEDFEDYPYTDSWDEGVPEFMDMGRFLEMDGPLYLVIRYAREGGKIYHMGLCCEYDPNEYEMVYPENQFDMESVRYFLNIHNKPLSPGRTIHWDVSLSLDSVSPTGAEIRLTGAPPEGTEFLVGDSYTLERRNELGAWEAVPVLDDSTWDEDVRTAEKFGDQRINWEKRHGVLPEGDYRILKKVETQTLLWVRDQTTHYSGGWLTVAAEFSLGKTGQEEQPMYMQVERGSPQGITVMLWPGKLPAGTEIWTGDAYTLQKKQGRGWVDLPLSGEPAWTGETFRVPCDTLETIDWQPLYGRLPSGEYRIAREISLHHGDGTVQHETVYSSFRLHASDRGQVTVADVLALSEKGENLDWADFESFDYVEIDTGFDFEPIRRFCEMDGLLNLSLHSGRADGRLRMAMLACEAPGENMEWMRLQEGREATEAFIAFHNAPLAEGLDNHWGIHLAVEDASPTGAAVQLDTSHGEKGLEIWASRQYTLHRWGPQGWEDVEPLTPWEGETFRESDAVSEDLDWTQRYGTLPPGQYRMAKKFRLYNWTEAPYTRGELVCYAGFTIE